MRLLKSKTSNTQIEWSSCKRASNVVIINTGKSVSKYSNFTKLTNSILIIKYLQIMH